MTVPSAPYTRIAGGPVAEPDPLQHPAPLVTTSVSKLSHELRHAETIAEWLKSSLLIPDAGDRVTLNQLDEVIEEELPYLTNVCHHPLDRLGVVRELLPAPRARRVPVAGLLRLASHREDWYGLEEGRIHPRRLLALTYVEELDFHENRVAGQLVDRLSRYLAARLRELRSLKTHIDQLTDHQRALHGDQTFRKRRRLSHLLADVAQTSLKGSAVVDQTLARLERVRGRLSTLHGSPVHRGVNRRSRLPVRLRRTNLLTNDGNYHHVADLWDVWARHELAARDTDREVAREFSGQFDSYVAAVTLRALAELGWQPVTPAGPPPADGGRATPLTATGDLANLKFYIDNGTIRLGQHGQTIASVIPFADALTRDRTPSEVSNCLRRIFAAAMAATAPTIVVYPGEREERGDAQLPAATHACAPLSAYGGPPKLTAVVPLTPLDLDGIERMARALRWVVHGLPMIDRYPPVLPQPLAPRGAKPDWLIADGTAWQARQRPTAYERAALLERASAVTPYQPPRRSRGQRPAPGNGAEDLTRTLDNCLQIFDLLERCLVCGRQPARFEPRDLSTFQCWCSEPGGCGAQWGTRFCQSCRRRFPVLWPSGATYTGTSGDQIDAAFGRDLLALPCATSADGSRFRCPWCATCQGAPSCGCGPLAP